MSIVNDFVNLGQLEEFSVLELDPRACDLLCFTFKNGQDLVFRTRPRRQKVLIHHCSLVIDQTYLYLDQARFWVIRYLNPTDIQLYHVHRAS